MDKPNFTLKFSCAGISIGLLLGICEGTFLLVAPLPIYDPRVGFAILIMAPVIDAAGFGLLGLVLGAAADFCYRKCLRGVSTLAAFGIVIAGADLTFQLIQGWVHISQSPHLVNFGIALTGGGIVACAAFQFGPDLQDGWIMKTAGARPWTRAVFWFTALIVGVLIACLAGGRVIRSRSWSPLTGQAQENRNRQPNIVLLALDAARADHFSVYGYSKPTTPNLDNLARQGLLFETAVASAPWTLPSFATVFTGLLPHQNRTSVNTPLPSGFSTLASILSARGYQTAGFNANWSYGTTPTGLAQGFDEYDDDNASLLTDFAKIGLGKAFCWYVYYPFIRQDYLPRRSAATLTEAVFRWFRRRPPRPYFLFINYFDVHEPYHAIPEVGNRFGNAQPTLAYRMRAIFDGRTWRYIEVPNSPAEQAELIAGYDSGLAYADNQIGNLLQFLKSSPEWSNTYVIVFADHGQGFGTHGQYGHVGGLNWELLHVPLIVSGPGIPKGRRVKDIVSLQQLFATVLDLSGGEDRAPEPNSLQRFWKIAPSGFESPSTVISELDAGGRSSISLVTAKWHFIRDSAGDLQLYDLTTDCNEVVNLAASPEYQRDILNLDSRLFERVQASSLPWLGEDYLLALGARQYSVLAAEHRVRKKWPHSGLQSTFAHGQEDELLHSLPYQ